MANDDVDRIVGADLHDHAGRQVHIPVRDDAGRWDNEPNWTGALATAAQTGQVMLGPYASTSVVNGLVSAGLGDFIWQDGQVGAAGFTINDAGRAQLARLRSEGWLDAGAQHIVTLVPTEGGPLPVQTARWECRCGLASGYDYLAPPTAERSGLEHAPGAEIGPNAGEVR